MNFIRNLLLITLLLSGVAINAQDWKRTQNWYFGDSAGLSFATDPPTVLTDGQMYALEGCATMSDTAGNLLFYTNGQTVWNKQHQVMLNGTGLFSTESIAQPALIVPQPENDSIYFIFTVGSKDILSTRAIRYSTVNIKSDQGMGKVIEKNITLANTGTEKLAATHHVNGRDVWVATHDYGNNLFYAFLVTEQGVVNCPVISRVGSVMTGSANQTELRFSPSGSLACISFWNDGFVELLKFNNQNGNFYNPIQITTSPGWVPGLIFSIDEKRLLVSAREKWIRCYNIDSFNESSINRRYLNLYVGGDVYSQFTYSGSNSHEIFLSWVGKDYLGKVIFSPIDTTVTFIDSAVSIAPRTGTYGMPQFISSYYYQPNIDISYHTNCNNDSIIFLPKTLKNLVSPSWQVYKQGNLLYTIGNQSLNYLFSDTGTYVVQLIEQADTISKEVFIEPSLELGKDTVICNTNEFTLNLPDNLRCIQWQDGSDTNKYEVTESGTYYVSGYNNRGCLLSDTIRIKMGTILAPVISRSGDSLYSDTGSYTYLWYHNGVAVGNNDPFIHINQTGNYQVEVTDSLGCTATSSLFSVTVLTIKTAENTQVRLFPNPIRESQLLTIDADEELQSIIIYDVHGKIVYQKSEIGSYTTEIRMSNRGIFFIHINQTIKAKIIIH